MTPAAPPRRLGLHAPVEVRLERRLDVPRWLGPATTVGAIAVALLLSALIIAIAGGDPVRTYLHILSAAFGEPGVISDTLVTATPLILTGVACALAFRMHLWNIGAEGQFFVGAWGAAAVVLVPLLPTGAPGYLVLPAMLVVGFLCGAVWGLIPGVLKARFGVNEIIVTLMLNYIAIAWNLYWVFGPWSEGGFQLTKQFPRQAWLPRLTDLAELNRGFAGMTVHLGFVIAIVVAVVVAFVLRRTRWGYEIKLIGDSPRAARYAGIDIGRMTIVVFAISGGIAGLAGVSEVAGVVHRLQGAISPGYGFTAIIVAYLAKFDPIKVIVAAIAFGALTLAGREIQPAGIPAMIQGILLFSLIGSEVLLRYRVRFVRRTI